MQMAAVADAPFIVEAERNGVPANKAQDNFKDFVVVRKISQASFHLGQAVELLCQGIKYAEGTPYEDPMDELIKRLEDLRDDLDSEKIGVRKGERW